MEKDVFECFGDGIFAGGGRETDFGTLRWERHQEYDGVSLKHLVNTDRTGGRFSCHLVRIAPDCRIGWHSHPDSMELHEIIRGSGTCLTDQGEVAYVPGVIGLIACGEFHEVRAGKDGLFLFAKFIAVKG